MADFIIHPTPLHPSTISAPPSKSHTLRAILFASLAHGKSTLSRTLHSPDTEAMITACRQIGAIIDVEDDRMTITGVAGQPRCPDDVIDCGNSGQVLRFFGAISALIDGYTILTGDHSIRFNRPAQALISGLNQLGAHCVSTKNDDRAPLIIKGPLQPGHAEIDGADSQPISGLLIAAAFLDGQTTLTVNNPGETPWIDLTLHWLNKFDIQVQQHNHQHYTVQGPCSIAGFHYEVPGDFSSVAFPIVAALIHQSQLSITHLDRHDTQGDKVLLDVLQRMGAQIEWTEQGLTVYPSAQLKGIDIDVNPCIDAVPILAVLGCFAKGQTTLFNAAIARKKESDRLRAITCELKKMGADIIEQHDLLIIKQSRLHAAMVQSHQDHRIAMALSIAATAASGTSEIQSIDCVHKSYGSFQHDLRKLGAKISS